MLALLGRFLVKLLGSGIAEPVLAYFRQRDASGRDIAVAGIEADKQRDLATLQSVVEANKLKVASQAAYPWIVYLIAIPPALHAAGVYLDSLPFWTPWGSHVIGSWGVPAPPPPYDDWQGKILLSFFVVAPVVQAIRTGAAAVARR
ncbi:hypothetical protein LNAOJCKE_0964 [Methylorubrum aminovorans]|uniref:Uncharacterized protein n=1 Tax=Methylorubrum aminovorans TaxID=269069 RepID=A0ABQ4U950_9HYPH|nr:hypothetical protein [Methylorubrum aminovorans]GJE63766.1 hypothetical protein LNAOJCKE_0964 [Methylorubrum aminovorans]GMA73607.1 hypothetical protein GCM10025880_00240 [Methylorubrum aminovorans]GMA73695.1 hypothetical protein GCM10025880_01120 [Methylorubrum aminovorans]